MQFTEEQKQELAVILYHSPSEGRPSSYAIVRDMVESELADIERNKASDNTEDPPPYTPQRATKKPITDREYAIMQRAIVEVHNLINGKLSGIFPHSESMFEKRIIDAHEALAKLGADQAGLLQKDFRGLQPKRNERIAQDFIKKQIEAGKPIKEKVLEDNQNYYNSSGRETVNETLERVHAISNVIQVLEKVEAMISENRKAYIQGATL